MRKKRFNAQANGKNPSSGSAVLPTWSMPIRRKETKYILLPIAAFNCLHKFYRKKAGVKLVVIRLSEGRALPSVISAC